jgi:hypothetical protein
LNACIVPRQMPCETICSGNFLCAAALLTAFAQEWLMTAFHAARLATALLVAGLMATFAAVVGVI